jgi:hypothetical protein
MLPKNSKWLATAALGLALAGIGHATEATLASDGATDTSLWTKPVWLTDLSFSYKESYDDNILGVSGYGLPLESSWVDAVGLKFGVNVAPFLSSSHLSLFSFTYNPEKVTYTAASQEDYTAHRLGTAVKYTDGALSFNLDQNFLYNDGNKLAPTYALNQLGGAAANQNDKYRNNFAHAPARERRNQFQDKYTASLQYDADPYFYRAVSSLALFDMNTYQFNTSNAPYKGYQNYTSRYDLNAGFDFGYKILPGLYFTLGYRVGEQEQDQFGISINSDRHFSSNNYQRVLFGAEGKVGLLTLKAAAGPDFRDFNPNTPIANDQTTRFYGEGSASIALPAHESLTFAFKEYVWVASTGIAPEIDTLASAVYHVDITKAVGFDAGYKFQKANYTLGNDTAGSGPAFRDDIDLSWNLGLNYKVTKQFSVTAGYAHEQGRNIDSELLAKYFPDYRDFVRGISTIGVQYKF